jgi:hypothetical protein
VSANKNYKDRIASLSTLLTGAFLVFSAPASAQEFSLLAGPLFSDSANTYSWSASYREGLGRFAAWSFSWINEGHIPEHHRDGQTIQAWGRLPIWNDRLELSAGTGPYRYFDTTAAGSGGDYSNTHGWGVLWSMRAAYYFDRRWIAQAQLNHIQVFGGPDTTALLLGIGYQLEAKGEPGPRERAVPRTSKVTNNEVTIMLGKTTLNSGNSESANAGSLEYRRGLWRYVDVTASYIHEGGQIQSRRDPRRCRSAALGHPCFLRRRPLAVSRRWAVCFHHTERWPSAKPHRRRPHIGACRSFSKLSARPALAHTHHMESRSHALQPRHGSDRSRSRLALLSVSPTIIVFAVASAWIEIKPLLDSRLIRFIVIMRLTRKGNIFRRQN